MVVLFVAMVCHVLLPAANVVWNTGWLVVVKAAVNELVRGDGADNPVQ